MDFRRYLKTNRFRTSGKAVRFHGRIILLAIVFILGAGTAVSAKKGVYEWAFIRLDYIRKEKARQLRRFCHKTHELAARLKNDEVMVEFFDVNLKFDHLTGKNAAPEELRDQVKAFREKLTNYYFNHYLAFYDIKFVSRRGDIFYSIRKESDYQKNVFSGKLAGTPLAERLRANPMKECFVDFFHYGSSDKVASFFIEPAYKNGNHLGWFVLQCAINKVNSLFAGAEQLGVSGETFLVNRESYMLVESSFEGDSTILKKRLDQKNINAKFRENRGHKIVTDYRGVTALTAFERFLFLGTEWLIVTKVDEAQILTEHFKLHRRYYNDIIARHLCSLSPQGGDRRRARTGQKRIHVDMDEFVKATHGEVLQTGGVSTCTAFMAACPGKFGYMAHISPYDKIYGGGATNLLGHIIKKIKLYDIYKYERQQVHFTIVANHLLSLGRIVDKLVDEGFMLPQIHVMHRADAASANISFDYMSNQIHVEWKTDKNSYQMTSTETGKQKNLGTILAHYLDEPQGR